MESEHLFQNKILDEKAAALFVGLAVKTLQARRAAHMPPAYVKIGRSVRYRVADLAAFLSDHRIDPERSA